MKILTMAFHAFDAEGNELSRKKWTGDDIKRPRIRYLMTFIIILSKEDRSRYLIFDSTKKMLYGKTKTAVAKRVQLIYTHMTRSGIN